MCKVKIKKSGKLPISEVEYNSSTKIPITKSKENNIIFSYKYFKCVSKKDKIFNNCFSSIYNYATWITLVIERIANFSTMDVNEIKNSGSSARFHLVQDGDLDKLKRVLCNIGLKLDDIFSQEESNNYYELSFGKGNGRMFGYLIDNNYYILLMDPNHLIYENLSKGAKYSLLHKNYDPWNSLLSDNNVYINKV